LDILVNLWMSNFDSYFYAFVDCPVDLTDWPWGDWHFLKRVEYFLNFFTIAFFEVSSCFLEAMLRSIFSEMSKTLRHFSTYDVSSMTQVLKSFYPHHSCSLDWTNE